MKPFSLSAFLRFLVGFLVIIYAGTLAFQPHVLEWLHEHPAFDILAVLAGAVFHWWNTYHHPEVSHGG